MSNQGFFFATKLDLKSGLKAFETTRPVIYAKTGLFDTPEVPVYMSSDEIKDLGINHSGNHNSESYLILDKSASLNIREIPQKRGGVKYAVDQLINGDSTVFWPGGLHKQDYLVGGRVATVHSDPKSLELNKKFSKAITKGFKKVGRYYCGPEAMLLYGKVRYITIHINQSKDYDFTHSKLEAFN